MQTSEGIICEQTKEEKDNRYLKFFLNRKNIANTVTIVLVLLSLVVMLLGWQWWSKASIAPVHSTQSVAAGVRELSSLLTAELQVVTTLEGEDHKLFGLELPVDLPGTKRVYLMVVPARVMAGIDLEKMGSDSVSIDEQGKKIHIILPQAELIHVSIELDKLKIFTSEGLLRPRTTIQESLQIINNGEIDHHIREEALASGILGVAEENGVKVLQNFYHSFGYQVEVEFLELAIES